MKTAILEDLEKKKNASNFGYFKGQAEAYIKTKPIEDDLIAEMNALSEAMWEAAAPQAHTFVVRAATNEDNAALYSALIDDFGAEQQGWGLTSWTNVTPAMAVHEGVLSVTSPRTKDVRDMLGLTRKVSVDLGGSGTLEVRMRAAKGSPFGVEAVLDGTLTRLHSYVPASGDWETVRLPMQGQRLTSVTLILAEPSAAAQWDDAVATYEFDWVRVELQKGTGPAYFCHYPVGVRSKAPARNRAISGQGDKRVQEGQKRNRHTRRRLLLRRCVPQEEERQACGCGQRLRGG
jgi:hypothetical protein